MSRFWPRSLRARLLVSVLLAILTTALLQAGLAWRAARDEADALFDYHMQQTAQSLRAGLPQGLLTGVIPLPEREQAFDFVLQIWTLDGTRVFESADQAELPQRAVLGFAEVQAHGSRYRVYSLQARQFVIQVAQDMAVRQRMAGSLAVRTALPILLLAPLLMLLVGWLVRHSLQPVTHVQAQLSQRRADDLTAVSADGLPEELHPLVHEFNRLLGRVEQAFDAQQRFVADAAHELRSPLTALKLQLQALRRAPDAEARERALLRLEAGLDRGTRLVEQLLALARQEAQGSMSTPPETVALTELVRLALADMAPVAQARGVDLGLDHADSATVTGRPEALRVLVRNLLDNAVKYTPPGGRVDVSLERTTAGQARLTIQDSGPGIAAADRARALQRFVRLSPTDNTTTTGSGLGLAIVQAIATQHQAVVTLDQADVLGGLKVCVVFPPMPSASSLPSPSSH